MPPEAEKNDPKGGGGRSGSHAENRMASDLTARMKFYTTHNTGEQLRRHGPVRTGKMPDRMEGR